MTEPTGRRKPNAALRKAFEASPLTCVQIAHDLYLYRYSEGRHRTDDQKIRRSLGLTRENIRTVDVDFGRRIARAIGINPQDVGL